MYVEYFLLSASELSEEITKKHCFNGTKNLSVWNNKQTTSNHKQDTTRTLNVPRNPGSVDQAFDHPVIDISG